jgi:hypothetical protein
MYTAKIQNPMYNFLPIKSTSTLDSLPISANYAPGD